MSDQPSPQPTASAYRLLPIIGGFVLVAAVAIALWWVLIGRGGSADYVYHGGVYSPAAPAAALDLTDQHGNPFSLGQLKDKVVLVYFGYTTCPDLCPTTLSDFSTIKEGLGPLADNVAFVLVTIDPDRDSQARLSEYLNFFDPEFIGLTGDPAALTAAQQAYGVSVERVEYPESATKYLMNHSALTYLIDPEGNLLVSYPYGTTAADIEADVRHILSENAR